VGKTLACFGVVGTGLIYFVMLLKINNSTAQGIICFLPKYKLHLVKHFKHWGSLNNIKEPKELFHC
jgi:hypothetical protein